MDGEDRAYNGRVSKVIEATGTVDEHGHLELDEPIAADGPRRVRVLVVVPDEEAAEVTEGEWLTAAARNPAFGLLNDPREDVYSASDGRPFRDPR